MENALHLTPEQLEGVPQSVLDFIGSRLSSVTCTDNLTTYIRGAIEMAHFLNPPKP